MLITIDDLLHKPHCYPVPGVLSPDPFHPNYFEEAYLLDVCYHPIDAAVGCLFDLRSATFLFHPEANTGVFIFRRTKQFSADLVDTVTGSNGTGTSEITWVMYDSTFVRTSADAIHAEFGNLLTGATLNIDAACVEFYAGYVAEGAIWSDTIPHWHSSIEIKGMATFPSLAAH